MLHVLKPKKNFRLRKNLWLDGASSHYARQVTNFLIFIAKFDNTPISEEKLSSALFVRLFRHCRFIGPQMSCMTEI
jgi:hypothetical protein